MFPCLSTNQEPIVEWNIWLPYPQLAGAVPDQVIEAVWVPVALIEPRKRLIVKLLVTPSLVPIGVQLHPPALRAVAVTVLLEKFAIPQTRRSPSVVLLQELNPFVLPASEPTLVQVTAWLLFTRG
jgi:hypothetical protein